MKSKKKNLSMDDPQLKDDNDPAYRDEMFETFKVMKVKPEELIDLDYRKRYAKWLEKQK